MKQTVKENNREIKLDDLNEITKCLIAGGVAFVADYSILIILNKVNGINYLLAAAVGFIFGLIVNFILSVNWVFKIRRIKNKYFEIILFSVVGIIGLGFNEGVIWLLTGLKSMPIQYSKLISAAAAFFLNYTLKKIILFRDKYRIG